MSDEVTCWLEFMNSSKIRARLTPGETYEKREGDYTIQTLDQWNAIEDEFLKDARRTGFISIDTEGLLRPEAVRLSRITSIDYTTESMGVVWVITTSGLGMTVKFDIRRMRSCIYGLTGRKKHFGQVLPQSFLSLLEDESVVKVGSGILGDIVDDFNPADVVISPVLELQWLVQEAKGLIYGDDISLATGLDYVCRTLFGFSYKPVKLKKGRPVPSSALTYRLYNWPMTLPPLSKNYLRNDSILPVSFLHDLIRRLGIQAPNIREALLAMVRDILIRDPIPMMAQFGGSLSRPAGYLCSDLLERVEEHHLRLHREKSDSELQTTTSDEDKFDEDGEEGPFIPLLPEEIEHIQTPDVVASSFCTEPISRPANKKRRLENPDSFPPNQICPDTLETDAQCDYGGREGERGTRSGALSWEGQGFGTARRQEQRDLRDGLFSVRDATSADTDTTQGETASYGTNSWTRVWTEDANIRYAATRSTTSSSGATRYMADVLAAASEVTELPSVRR